MENWPLFFVVVLGLVLIGVLVVSANISVKKLVGIAAYFNLSSTFMGMTVVSLAKEKGKEQAARPANQLRCGLPDVINDNV